MLVLGCKEGSRVLIGDSIIVTVCKLKGNRVRLGFEAPPSVLILREEAAQQRRDQAVSADVTALPVSGCIIHQQDSMCEGVNR